MTDKEKLKVYKMARQLIYNDSAFGICYAMQYSISRIYGVSFYGVTEHNPIMDSLALKYNQRNDGAYWFGLDIPGKNKRIEILDTEIKLLNLKSD